MIGCQEFPASWTITIGNVTIAEGRTPTDEESSWLNRQVMAAYWAQWPYRVPEPDEPKANWKKEGF